MRLEKVYLVVFLLLWHFCCEAQPEVIHGVSSKYQLRLPVKPTLVKTKYDTIIWEVYEAAGVRNISIKTAQIKTPGVYSLMSDIDISDRAIVYSKTFLDDLCDMAGSDNLVRWVAAHELGHHFCGHLLFRYSNKVNEERQADYFAGYLMCRMHKSINDALAAVKLFGDTKSKTHPPKDLRIQDIVDGYTFAMLSIFDSVFVYVPDPDPDPILTTAWHANTLTEPTISYSLSLRTNKYNTNSATRALQEFLSGPAVSVPEVNWDTSRNLNNGDINRSTKKNRWVRKLNIKDTANFVVYGAILIKVLANGEVLDSEYKKISDIQKSDNKAYEAMFTIKDDSSTSVYYIDKTNTIWSTFISPNELDPVGRIIIENTKKTNT